MKLILLYGQLTDKHNPKYQNMIEGKMTCGYKPYAENFGEIIYLSPQKVYQEWEKSIYNPKELIRYLKSKPDYLVWAVKHDLHRDKTVLRHIKNKKIYYSCNAQNCINHYCDISLVDDKKRIKDNAKLWFKGKDPRFWKSYYDNKKYDYVLVGKRADKNEIYFLKRLDQEVNKKRKILWIGGEKHKDKVKLKNHQIDFTPFFKPLLVAQAISSARVGILYTSHKAEGFPQTFLEMTMSGVPVVYNKDAPKNDIYFNKHNCLLTDDKDLIKNSEYLLKYSNEESCREYAINHYSLKKSYNHICNLVNGEKA